MDRVRKLIVEQWDVAPGKVTPQARLREDLKADSLDCVELVIALEEEFNIAIPDEAATQVRTVGDILAYLRRAVRECA